MFAKFALALLFATSTAANPFEPAKTAKKNAAKTKYVNRLVRGAKPTARSQLGRKLNDADEDYMPDISGYSVKFEQCQFIKAFDEDMVDDEDAGTVLATKRFVVFRLCPTGGDSCNDNYGEYLAEMEEYLEAYVEYAQEQQEEWCEICDENCEDENQDQNQDADDADEDGGRKLDDNANGNANGNYDCSCKTTCYKIENMEANGYVDATEFLECQQIDEDENNGAALYAGPYCSGGEKIKIGVFSDENCMFMDYDKSIESYMQDGDGSYMKLSHALLKKTYDSSSPVSCLVVDEDEDANDDGNNDNGEEEEPEVLDMCQELYEASAKCEKVHGFDNGYADYAAYENQFAQEDVVCNFISSIKNGAYDEDGEIHVSSGGINIRSSGSGTTGGQKFALTFFIIGTVGLAAYAAMLHSQLTKGSKADLSKQGGALA